MTLPDTPLQLTTARWFNRRRRVKGRDGWGEKWDKVLAHTGHLPQFAYGTDTESTWNRPLQRCAITTQVSRVVVADVDHAAKFATTRLGHLLGIGDAWSIRDEDHFHVPIDARGWPGRWPVQGPIPGADVKSNGWVPLPGCTHWTGARYEPQFTPDGLVRIVPATAELMAAILADRAESGGYSSGGVGGTGGGHDGRVAARVLGWVRAGLGKQECYSRWQQIAVPLDPSWPFTREDFERHHRTAVAKAAAGPAPGHVVVTPEMDAYVASITARDAANDR